MNIPNIRFIEFTSEWNHYKLQELCNIYLGVTYTPSYVKQGKIFISSKNISKGYLDLSDVKYITEEEYKKISNNAKPKKGDVLFTRVGSNLGNPTVIETDKELTIFVSLGYLRTNETILNNYFSKYWMESNYFWHQVDSKVAGGAKQNLNTGWISKFDINIPDIKEQYKIAKLFKLIDNKMKLQQKKIDNLKLYKKYLNKYIFEDCTNEYCLKDLLEEYNKRTTSNSEYEILSSTANGIVLQSEYFNKQTASQDTTGYKILPKGYITYRSMSDTGEFHFNEQKIADYGIVSPAYPVFNVNSEKANKDYLLYYMNENKHFINSILSTKEGGTRFALSYSKLLSINIKLPSFEKQMYYSKLIKSINNKIEIEDRKYFKLSELKKGLMQNMFV